MRVNSPLTTDSEESSGKRGGVDTGWGLGSSSTHATQQTAKSENVGCGVKRCRGQVAGWEHREQTSVQRALHTHPGQRVQAWTPFTVLLSKDTKIKVRDFSRPRQVNKFSA